MKDDHYCWWTRRRETELSDDGLSIVGVGIPIDVLREAAAFLGVDLEHAQSVNDPYSEDITLGDVATGATHDDCFFRLSPITVELKLALVESVLARHQIRYGSQFDKSAAIRMVLDRCIPGATIRLRTDLRRCQLTLRAFPLQAGLVARLFARREVVPRS